MNIPESLNAALGTPSRCRKCGNLLSGYTAIRYINTSIVRVCKCGEHNHYKYWGCGSEWIGGPFIHPVYQEFENTQRRLGIFACIVLGIIIITAFIIAIVKS